METLEAKLFGEKKSIEGEFELTPMQLSILQDTGRIKFEGHDLEIKSIKLCKYREGNTYCEIITSDIGM